MVIYNKDRKNLKMTKFTLVFYTIFVHILLVKNVVEGLKRETIVGGNELIKGQIKYQVSIQMNGNHVCGGGIIHDIYIITAAHCFIEDDFGTFVSGAFKISFSFDLKIADNPIKADISIVYVLKSYDPTIIDPNESHLVAHDIAVVKLTQTLQLASNPIFKKLELPPRFFSHLRKVYTIAGHGYNWIEIEFNHKTNMFEEYGSSDGKLRYSEVKVESNFICNKYYEETLPASNMCARNVEYNIVKAGGVCIGDSGGPLVFNGNILVGILAAGSFLCDERGVPGIYTRVTHYLSFINNALKDKKTANIRAAILIKTNSTVHNFYEF